MREPLLRDVAEHAAKDRDPDSPGDEHVGPIGLIREQKASLRLLDLDRGSDGKLGERPLERGVAQARAETEHAALVRRRDDGDVPARALLVVVWRVEKGDPEVLARLEVDLAAEQVEDDE